MGELLDRPELSMVLSADPENPDPPKPEYSITYVGGGETHKLLHPDHFWPDGTLKSYADRLNEKPTPGITESRKS